MAQDYFPWKIPSGAQAHTALFSVEYKNYYKIVKTTGATTKTYLLVQRGCTAPTGVVRDSRSRKMPADQNRRKHA